MKIKYFTLNRLQPVLLCVPENTGEYCYNWTIVKNTPACGIEGSNPNPNPLRRWSAEQQHAGKCTTTVSLRSVQPTQPQYNYESCHLQKTLSQLCCCAVCQWWTGVASEPVTQRNWKKSLWKCWLCSLWSWKQRMLHKMLNAIVNTMYYFHHIVIKYQYLYTEVVSGSR